MESRRFLFEEDEVEGSGGEFGGVGEIKRFLPCCFDERVEEDEEADGLETCEEIRRDLFNRVSERR